MSGTGFEIKEICKCSPVYPVINRSSMFIYFSISLAVFLIIFTDKIIRWFTSGYVFSRELWTVGSYNQVAFWGLMPLLSLLTILYFNKTTKLLIENRYDGTFADIQRRSSYYKNAYLSSAKILLVASLTVAVLINTLNISGNLKIDYVLSLISLGSVFLSITILNFVVLRGLGRIRIAKISLIAVAAGGVLSFPFAVHNLEVVSIGFLLGSTVGGILSSIFIASVFSKFEHNIFRLLQNNY